MRKLHALLLPLCAAGCATEWTQVGAEHHPGLRPDAEMVVFERGRGGAHERKVDIRAGEEVVPADTVDEVMDFARPIDSAEAAVAYSELVRELEVQDSGAVGMIVRPDPALDGTGGSGRYSRSDAAAWGIEFETKVRPNGGGFEVTRVALHRPRPHPLLTNSIAPWRLVLLREVVMRNGTIHVVNQKTLTNGTDAARFAPY